MIRFASSVLFVPRSNLLCQEPRDPAPLTVLSEGFWLLVFYSILRLSFELTLEEARLSGIGCTRGAATRPRWRRLVMRSTWMTLVTIVLLASPARTEPLAPGRFDPSWTGLEFGIPRERLLAFLKERIYQRYEAQIRDIRDVAVQDRLKRARDAEIAQVGSDFVEFVGQRTGWDISVVRGEFAHRLGEAMLPIQEGKDRYYFFFVKDVFYKMVRTVVERPMTSVFEELSRVYGRPTHIEFQDPKEKTGVRLARWEQGLLDVSVEDRTRLYQCIVVRWVLRAADEAVRAEWEKARTTESGIDPIVQEAAEPQGPDSYNPVDEILGRTPTLESPPASPPPKKPKQPRKK